MKTYKNQNQELDKAIELLEIKRNIKLEELKNQLSYTYQSVKPINILNQTLQDFKDSTQVKSNLLQSVVSLAGGYASKKLLLGKTSSIFTKLLGYVVQYGVTKFISRKVDSDPTN
jgi:hypothetical protein